MNLLSLPLFLAIWGIFSAILLFLLKNSESGVRKNRALLFFGLCLAALLFPVYSKVALGGEFEFYSSDESGLKGNFEVFENSGNIWSTHSSGPGMLLLLNMLTKTTGLGSTETVNFFGAIAAVFTIVTIMVFLKKATKSTKLSIGGAACALYSAYLIWPIIEVRPQQIGFLIFVFAAMLLFDALKEFNKKALILSLFLIVSSSLLHVLSHLFVLPLLLLTIGYAIISKRDFGAWAFLACCLLILTWFVSIFFSFSFFDSVFDFHFVLKRLLLQAVEIPYDDPLVVMHNPIITMPEFKFSFLLAGVTAAMLAAVLFLLFFVFLAKRWLASVVQFAVKKTQQLEEKKLFFFVAAIGLSLIAVQITLHLGDIGEWYYHPFFFVFFELGNLLFGLLALYGLAKSLKEHNSKGVQKILLPVISIAVVFAVNLGTGFVMMKGFENISIRAMNYLVAFLGVFAFIGISKMKMEQLKSVSLAFLLLFPTSFVVGTRDPVAIKTDIIYLPLGESKLFFETQRIQKDYNYPVVFVNTLRHGKEKYPEKDRLVSTRMWELFKK